MKKLKRRQYEKSGQSIRAEAERRRGEVKHLTFEDEIFGPEFEPLAVAVVEYGLHPVFICESDDTQAKDAVEMKNIFEKVKKETV